MSGIETLIKKMEENKGNYYCLNQGNGGYHLYIWDNKKDSINDDGQKAIDGGFIKCETKEDCDNLSNYETSGDVEKIY